MTSKKPKNEFSITNRTKHGTKLRVILVQNSVFIAPIDQHRIFFSLTRAYITIPMLQQWIMQENGIGFWYHTKKPDINRYASDKKLLHFIRDKIDRKEKLHQTLKPFPRSPFKNDCYY